MPSIKYKRKAMRSSAHASDEVALNSHLRRQMLVNMQGYLQAHGIPPASAARIAADLTRDV
ncbi:hypothetical protein ColTof4_09334 [Colletotrichum tofieldiae]|nr:hypothetical protein ColTof3_12620 [Colletotrichum tofieldiae]GKT76911.1 hypothetical protein ColTof4_09334 [Colletotrichum tofieldiae]GKT92643.1 hypothetical protein Ct61P_10493 [Colletotrichum tofieldiae]